MAHCCTKFTYEADRKRYKSAELVVQCFAVVLVKWYVRQNGSLFTFIVCENNDSDCI